MAEFDGGSLGETHEQIPSRDDVNLQTKTAIENIRRRLPDAFALNEEKTIETEQGGDQTSSRNR